jgi:hypothetical protein
MKEGEVSSETSETFRQTTGITSQKTLILKEPHGAATPTSIQARSFRYVLVFEAGNTIKTTKLVVERRCLSFSGKDMPIPCRERKYQVSIKHWYLSNEQD